MHRKNGQLQLSKATGPIENFLKKFEAFTHLETSKRNSLKKLKSKKIQHSGLNLFRNNKQHAILIEDENIGPCIANRNNCMSVMINQEF